MSRRWVLVGLAVLAGSAPPARAFASCKDPDVPLGADCRHYGEAWDDSAGFLARLHLVGWLSARTLTYAPANGSVFDGNVEASPTAYHFPGSALGTSPLRTYGGETGVAWMPLPYFYVGLAGGYGLGSSSPRSFTASGLTITPGVGQNTEDTIFGGVLGARLPLGRVSLRVDALVGGSWFDFDQYAVNGQTQLTATGSASAFFLEPRVHVDVWLSPFFSLGVFAGMPDLDPASTNVGITLAAHTTAFDGRFWAF